MTFTFFCRVDEVRGEGSGYPDSVDLRASHQIRRTVKRNVRARWNIFWVWNPALKSVIRDMRIGIQFDGQIDGLTLRRINPTISA